MGDDFVQLSETGTNATPTLNELINEMVAEEKPSTKKFMHSLTKLVDMIGVSTSAYSHMYFGGIANEAHWKNMEEYVRRQHIINYIYVTMGAFK